MGGASEAPSFAVNMENFLVGLIGLALIASGVLHHKRSKTVKVKKEQPAPLPDLVQETQEHPLSEFFEKVEEVKPDKCDNPPVLAPEPEPVPDPTPSPGTDVKIYCLKCKDRHLVEAFPLEENGKDYWVGICPVYGHNIRKYAKKR